MAMHRAKNAALQEKQSAIQAHLEQQNMALNNIMPGLQIMHMNNMVLMNQKNNNNRGKEKTKTPKMIISGHKKQQ